MLPLGRDAVAKSFFFSDQLCCHWSLFWSTVGKIYPSHADPEVFSDYTDL